MYILYTLFGCPFCNKVKVYLKENNVNYIEKEITSKANEEELIEIGGKKQVPFLIDDVEDKKMYESTDIIEYISLRV